MDFLPSQKEPFPVNPLKHVQVKEPVVSMQSPLSSQGCGSLVHSLISIKKQNVAFSTRMRSAIMNKAT